MIGWEKILKRCRGDSDTISQRDIPGPTSVASK